MPSEGSLGQSNSRPNNLSSVHKSAADTPQKYAGI